MVIAVALVVVVAFGDDNCACNFDVDLAGAFETGLENEKRWAILGATGGRSSISGVGSTSSIGAIGTDGGSGVGSAMVGISSAAGVVS